MSPLRSRLIAAVVLAFATSPLAAQASWSPVEDAMGRKAAMQPGDVARFNFPRTDLTVTAGGVTLKPAFALGSWVAMKPIGGGQVVAMGDLVLLDAEIPAVMSALQAGGVEQSALHNHLLNETPHIMYMHVMAHGDPVKIARAVHDALAKSGTPIGAAPAAATPSAADLHTAGIAKAPAV